MRHIASIKLVLCLLLFAPSLAMAQDQRVFVRTSFPTVTFPTQPNQEVVLASQPVALAMRKLWSFDIFAEGVFNQYPITDHWQGYVDAWICDEINCTGNIKANLAHSVMYISTDFVYRFLHLTGTFAQTNRGQQTIAILTGQLAYSLSDSSGDVASFPRLLSDTGQPQTQPIDLYTGNRYVVLTATSACPNCQVSPSNTFTITIFRVNMLP